MTQSPFVVLWRVMNTCNLACPFCAYDKRLAFPRSVVDTQEVARMIDLLGQWRPGRPVVLSWLGGEPTMWQDFETMTARAAHAGLRQSLTTNGTTLGSRRMRATLAERFDEITISVDAIGTRHEELRGWPGGFAKLARWVPELVNAAPDLMVRANVVLMRQTVDQFETLCETLAGWGVRTITFNQLGGRDRPEFFPAHRLRPQDAARLRAALPALRQRMHKRGVAILGGDPYVDRILQSAEDGQLPITSCQVARDFLFIDEACRVAPCAFVEDHFGIRTDQLLSVRDLDAVSGRLCADQANRPHDACENCMSTQQFSKFAA
ncbi:radical SAM protein [Shimia ponticola]|uniref:radical SAM protein n=1 Tax=Shimia ponticola TaxID=2582893 RepID=UPI0011BE2C3D|nr:radical SAM protein [Shimia ponticola]